MRWETVRWTGRGVTLAVRRIVDQTAPAVLLLHGLGVGGSVFQAFGRRLLPEWVAVAPDLRGHGDSDAPASGYTPSDYAQDLIELIGEHLDPPLPVVGHSLGALVGLELARLRPELVRWLVLLDPPLDAALNNPEIADVFRLRHAGPGELEAYLLERNPGGGHLLADGLARLFRQAADAAFEALLDGPRYQPGPIEPPTLLLQADPSRGGVLGDAAARRAVDAFGNATLVKVAGASHAVHASHPAEVAQAMRDFASTTVG